MLLNTATLAFTSLFLLPASAQAPGAAAGQAQANAAAAAAAAQGAGQNPAALAAASAVSVASVASVQQAADAAAAAQAAATTAAAAPVDTAAAVADPAVPVSTAAAAAAAAAQATGSVAGTWPGDIVGTWSTKSKQTLTGPGFYDPIDERLIEPSKPGISYSFTADGWYEEAYYRAIANPTNPKCPSGIMQWQHGNWVMNGTGSLILTPIAVDGRQLLSSPCDYDDGIYTRYNTSEVFERYSVYTDPYHNVARLDLFQFDGSPMHPMYIAYTSPEMLPTSTLNPTTGTAASTAAATSNSKLRKRSLRGHDGAPIIRPQAFDIGLSGKEGSVGSVQVVQRINTDRLWWFGLGMMGFGGLLYLGPRRMGIQL
ncbi:hypothetical protein B0A50_02227 [Salinomyces thailandicus]|uniref:Protein ROT1 n=1 Tax=Salinomyces thailandicus TaxID=706561 RepID=A0A4U0U7Y4_9PEZI|nr:hypothetical protein B0A50_02227 [Salinomyces thailandica]